MTIPSSVQTMLDGLININGAGPVGRAELHQVLEALFGVNPETSGTVATGSEAEEMGNSYAHQTILTVNTTLPAIAGGAALAVGKLLYTFPAGRILVTSCSMQLAITQTTAHINANTPEVGIGTVIATGAIATLTTATFKDLVTGTAAANCTGTPTIAGGVPTAAVPLLIPAASAHTVHANAAATWAALGDPAALLTGYVIINWQFLSPDV